MGRLDKGWEHQFSQVKFFIAPLRNYATADEGAIPLPKDLPDAQEIETDLQGVVEAAKRHEDQKIQMEGDVVSGEDLLEEVRDKNSQYFGRDPFRMAVRSFALSSYQLGRPDNQPMLCPTQDLVFYSTPVQKLRDLLAELPNDRKNDLGLPDFVQDKTGVATRVGAALATAKQGADVRTLAGWQLGATACNSFGALETFWDTAMLDAMLREDYGLQKVTKTTDVKENMIAGFGQNPNLFQAANPWYPITSSWSQSGDPFRVSVIEEVGRDVLDLTIGGVGIMGYRVPVWKYDMKFQKAPHDVGPLLGLNNIHLMDNVFGEVLDPGELKQGTLERLEFGAKQFENSHRSLVAEARQEAFDLFKAGLRLEEKTMTKVVRKFRLRGVRFDSIRGVTRGLAIVFGADLLVGLYHKIFSDDLRGFKKLF